jgi:hypothetical protein
MTLIVRSAFVGNTHGATRQGEAVFHDANSLPAQAVDLSVWHDVQGLGILYLSVMPGGMKRKV